MPLYLPELLCPAGSEEALRAAVDSGANAVYLGYTAYGARASAVNFDEDALVRAVSYAHLYHARVHVTVNTLIKPGEFAGVRQALSVIDGAGADAVIVQDPGVAALVRREFPRLRLHASTQMALCSAFGVETARKLGFDRVVLARECGLSEIRKACETGVEVEVFIHGALCTAVSGRCLMSSMSGGRSGNRGRCAQPCRQCFAFGGREGPLLSQRDLCLLDDLPDLCQAGVASLKIEGRLKSPEYVAVVTQVYRKALDDLARGEFHPGDSAEKEKLLQIYNRGGFTRGHAMGQEDAALMTESRVSHEGVPMGRLVSVSQGMAKLLLTRDLHDGDSLQLRGREDADMRYSGHDLPAGQIATLRLRPGLQAEAGMPVSRLSDAHQLEDARAHRPSPITVHLAARFAAGQPMTLAITDGTVSATVTGPEVQSARSRATAAEEVRRQLEKLGETPFVAQSVQLAMEDTLFLPVSALNALRRDAAALLQQERTRAFAAAPRAPFTPDFWQRPGSDAVGPNTLAVLFSDPSLADELEHAGATLCVLDCLDWRADRLDAALDRLPGGVWLRLPPQLSQEDLESALPVIRRHAQSLGGLMAESVGQLNVPLALPILAGEGIPATNPEGVQALRRTGICGFTLWPEWTGEEQRGLAPFALPTLVKMYGRETLMLLNHCPERAARGLQSRREACEICRGESMVCGRENAVLIDRKGYAFPLARTRFTRGCEIQMLGALPTDLRAQDEARRALGSGMLLRFTVEQPEEQLRLTALFAALLRGERVQPPEVPSTSGHWLRGID